MIDDGTIRKNSFYDTSGNIVNGDAVMNITPWDTIVSDDADDNDKMIKTSKWKIVMLMGTIIVYFHQIPTTRHLLPL